MHEQELKEYERQIEDLRSTLKAQQQRIETLEQDIAEHVTEKSKLQAEALKDKETAMNSQLEVSQLKIQVKELELSVKTAAAQSTEAESQKQQQEQPQRNEMFNQLIEQNIELQREKLTKEFEEKERKLDQTITDLKQ